MSLHSMQVGFWPNLGKCDITNRQTNVQFIYIDILHSSSKTQSKAKPSQSNVRGNFEATNKSQEKKHIKDLCFFLTLLLNAEYPLYCILTSYT